MNNVGQLAFTQGDVGEPDARFEVSAVQIHDSLQRASGMPRIPTLQKTLTNQGQQNYIVLRAYIRQSQSGPRSRQKARIRLRTRLRPQQSCKVVNKPGAVWSHV